MYVTTFRRKQFYRKRLFARSIIWSLVFRLWLSYLRLFLLCLDTYDFLCLSFPLFLSSTSVFVSVSLPLSSLVFFFFLFLPLLGRSRLRSWKTKYQRHADTKRTTVVGRDDKKAAEEYRAQTGKSSGETKDRVIEGYLSIRYIPAMLPTTMVGPDRTRVSIHRHDTTRYDTVRYDTTRHDTERLTFTGCVVKTDSRGLFENCMLVPAERCSGVPLY